MPPRTVADALKVIDEASTQLDALLDGKLAAARGIDPADLVLQRLDSWKVVYRPLIAAHVGPAALAQLDKILDAKSYPVPIAVPRRSRSRYLFPDDPPEPPTPQPDLRVLRHKSVRQTLVGIRVSVETLGERYLTPADAAGTTTLTVEREGVYFAGEQFDAMQRLDAILSSAKTSISIIDAYVADGTAVLGLLSSKTAGVTVNILTDVDSKTHAVHPKLPVQAKTFNGQYGGLSIRTSSAFHDRFVIVDDAAFFHFGASLKDLATKRGFMFSRIEEPSVIDLLRREFTKEWAAASVVV